MMQLISNVIDTLSGQSHEQAQVISQVISRQLDDILDEMSGKCEDISGAMVSSIDGIAWAQRLRSGFDKHRFAAMSSALLALSDNLAKEGQTGATQNVMIEGDKGHIFVLHAGANLLLTIFTKPKSNLGITLAYARQAAEKIAYMVIKAA